MSMKKPSAGIPQRVCRRLWPQELGSHSNAFGGGGLELLARLRLAEAASALLHASLAIALSCASVVSRRAAFSASKG